MAVTPPVAGAAPAFGPARLREVLQIARMYRAQPADSRRFYHPLPFDPPRLLPLLAGMILLQLWVRFWSRVAPSLCVLVWVARGGAKEGVIGMATGRFYRDADHRLVARTGLFIDPRHRRAHLGRDLGARLLEECRRLHADRAEALILPDNAPSRRAHASLGYAVRPTVFHDRHLDETDYLLGTLDLTNTGAPRGPPPTSTPERASA